MFATSIAETWVLKTISYTIDAIDVVFLFLVFLFSCFDPDGAIAPSQNCWDSCASRNVSYSDPRRNRNLMGTYELSNSWEYLAKLYIELDIISGCHSILQTKNTNNMNCDLFFGGISSISLCIQFTMIASLTAGGLAWLRWVSGLKLPNFFWGCNYREKHDQVWGKHGYDFGIFKDPTKAKKIPRSGLT